MSGNNGDCDWRAFVPFRSARNSPGCKPLNVPRWFVLAPLDALQEAAEAVGICVRKLMEAGGGKWTMCRTGAAAGRVYIYK
jgi:hypothetical protein